MTNFDFKEWVRLHKECPDTFEEQRQAQVEQLIQEAPQCHQQRLRGLQFQIDMQRKLCSNPYASMIKLSQLMTEALSQLVEACDYSSKTAAPKHSADILSFERN